MHRSGASIWSCAPHCLSLSQYIRICTDTQTHTDIFYPVWLSFITAAGCCSFLNSPLFIILLFLKRAIQSQFHYNMTGSFPDPGIQDPGLRAGTGASLRVRLMYGISVRDRDMSLGKKSRRILMTVWPNHIRPLSDEHDCSQPKP